MINSKMDSIIKRFNQQEILTRTDYTFVEYVEELMKFQTESAKLIFGQDNVEGIRMNEVVAKYEAMTREKKLGNNQDIFEGHKSLRTIEKEIAVAISGKRGEDRVAHTFQYVNRPDASFYRNLYICNENDGGDETELDAVVLTKNGLVILEVKTAKNDITIAPDGRILFNNSSCYHDISIGDKMMKKRRLLKEKIQKELLSKGISKDVFIDSILVFSTPKGIKIHVHDQFRQENYCFRGSLYRRIDSFESDVVYTDSELEELSTILKNIETAQKRFEVKFDPEEIKHNFAKAYILLTQDTEEEISDPKVYNLVEIKSMKKELQSKKKSNKKIQRVLAGTATMVSCASLLTLPALGIATAGVSITGGFLAGVLK